MALLLSAMALGSSLSDGGSFSELRGGFSTTSFRVVHPLPHLAVQHRTQVITASACLPPLAVVQPPPSLVAAVSVAAQFVSRFTRMQGFVVALAVAVVGTIVMRMLKARAAAAAAEAARQRDSDAADSLADFGKALFGATAAACQHLFRAAEVGARGVPTQGGVV